MLTYRQDQAMIALLSGVVVVLIVCHTPKAVINIYESYQVLLFVSFFLIFEYLQTGAQTLIKSSCHSFEDIKSWFFLTN